MLELMHGSYPSSAATPRRASQVLLRLAYYLLACLLTMVFTGLLFLLRGAIGPSWWHCSTSFRWQLRPLYGVWPGHRLRAAGFSLA